MSETVPFEGVEKRLVIQFANGYVHYDIERDLGEGSMMKSPIAMSVSEWQSVLDYANCSIISAKELTAKGEAEGEAATRVYLLSESTLLVWRTGFLLKTCGRTTPFLALQRILDLYRCKSASDLHVSWMTYSRLDFLYPENQISPHRSFNEEIAYFQNNFITTEEFDSDSSTVSTTDGGGSSVGGGSLSPTDTPPIIGGSSNTAVSPDYSFEDILPTTISSMENNLDSTYATTSCLANSLRRVKSVDNCKTFYAAIPAGDHVLYAIFATPCEHLASPGYHMEEVLMTQIRQDCVRRLTGADNTLESQNRVGPSLLESDLQKSHTKSVLDQFWFDPCGYSANGLFLNRNNVDYFSTHISPEPVTSYASLEIGTWGKTTGAPHKAAAEDFSSLKNLTSPFAAKFQNHTTISIIAHDTTTTSNISDIITDEPSLSDTDQDDYHFSSSRGNNYPAQIRSFRSGFYTCRIIHHAK